MAGFVVLNNLESLVADSPLAAGATTLNVTPGDGANFPSTFPYTLTIWDETTYIDPTDDSGMEIMYCTGRTTDALTISRGEEGTGDVDHLNGHRVAMLITAGMFNAATYGIQPQIDALSSYFDRTGTVLTTLTPGDTLSLLDDQLFALGTGEDAKFLWETADANANSPMIVMPEGDATNVPVLVVGDASISGQDLGFFDGVTEPLISVIDDDKDSHIDIGFAADDKGVIQVIGAGTDLCLNPAGLSSSSNFRVGTDDLSSSNAVEFVGGNMMFAIKDDGSENFVETPGLWLLSTDLNGDIAGWIQFADAADISHGPVIKGYVSATGDSLDIGSIGTGTWLILQEDLSVFMNIIQAKALLVLTKTDSYTIATSDFGKTIRMNSADAKIFTFPSVGAAEDGSRVTISKIGAGQVTLQMVDSDKIHDSSATGTLLNAQAGEVYATVTAEYCHATVTWNLISSVGTWTTT